jgi:hypothetical protein
MKTLLVPACLLALSSTRDEVALRFTPAEESVFVRTFDAEASYHLAALSYRLGELEFEEEELGDVRMEFQEHVAVRDELAAAGEARPRVLVRRFEELSQETSYSSGEEEQTTRAGSPLEERSVRFTWDEDEERFAVDAADDEELADEVAELLDEDMDLRLVLPDGEVEVGDEWELDARLYLAFMWPGGLLDWRDEEQEEDTAAEDRARNRQTIDNLEGTGRARLAELLEEDGRTLAVLEVELAIETGLEFELEEEGMTGTMTTRIERELEGRILWDIEAGHAVSAELEGEAVRETTRPHQAENEEGDTVEYFSIERQEGTVRYTATIERE